MQVEVKNHGGKGPNQTPPAYLEICKLDAFWNFKVCWTAPPGSFCGHFCGLHHITSPMNTNQAGPCQKEGLEVGAIQPIL